MPRESSYALGTTSFSMAPKRLSKPRDGRADSSAQHESREDEASQNDLESSGEENRALQMARKMRKDVKLSASSDQRVASG